MAGGRAKLQWRRPKTCPTGETRAFDEKGACLSALLRDRTLFSREVECLFVGCQYVTLKVDHAAVFIRRDSGTSE